MSPDETDIKGETAIQPVTSTQVGVVKDDLDKGKAGASVADDPAAQFLATVGPFPPMTPEQEKKLVRKIDRWMIPLVRFQNDSLVLVI